MINRKEIGSIVTIKNEIKKIMIIGYQDNKYIGVLFPLGYINSEQNITFGEDDIIDVYCLGYKEG